MLGGDVVVGVQGQAWKLQVIPAKDVKTGETVDLRQTVDLA